MPEGDTVFRTCARLHEALAGSVLLAAELRWPGLSTARLAGMTVREVVPRGKHILVRFEEGWTLHSHLKMEGQWRIERTEGRGSVPEERRPERAKGDASRRAPHNPHIRAILTTGEWTAIGIQLGQLDLVRTSEEHTLVGHLGPDILDDDFDLALAVTNLAASGTTVGAALLDQRNLAGIGTMWACEALFLQRLNPWSQDVGEAQLTALVERARLLMRAGLPHAVPSSTGSRRAGENTWVHGRSGRPCRRCGSTVRVAPIGPPTRERAMFYCPTCQSGVAPTDDGRPIAPLGSGRSRGGPSGYRR
nr:DNA-formamidopyrimidine glycosylase family protein [Propionicimonas sp.]